MIQVFVDRFLAKEAEIKAKFAERHPDSYVDIVRVVVEAVRDEDGYGEPSPDRIHTINDGDYQGTLVFVIGAEGYQPDSYWYVKVYYGSCSGCDTLERIRSYQYDTTPDEQQVKDYWTLALHVVQQLRAMDDGV